MPVTQKFIAEQAGVTPKTVSLFMQNSPLVAEKTRRKIRSVMDQYSYFPNYAAMSVRKKQFMRIAFIYTPDFKDPETRSPAPQFIAYINGAALELAKHGYSLVLEPFTSDAEARVFHSCTDFFSSVSVDGIIGLPGTFVPVDVDETIRNMDRPAVWINRESDDPTIDCIAIDEEKGSELIVEHLLGKGCSRLAWFGPDPGEAPTYHYSVGRRYSAARVALRRHGKDFSPVVTSCWNDGLDELAMQLLATRPLPDAVICYNYNFMEAVCSAAAELRLRPYNEFDLFHFASAWEYHPWITDRKNMLVLPESELGALGARHILRRIMHEDTSELPTRLCGTLHLRSDAKQVELK